MHWSNFSCRREPRLQRSPQGREQQGKAARCRTRIWAGMGAKTHQARARPGCAAMRGEVWGWRLGWWW
ncbi:hypothetical protein B0T16DRAFT_411734 [Cercophora newfieldiana]|uniref:Uncharacterized protein n=1 Tax=Cercophora newfieldiana TaxID=92897 RepID=A0AA40CQA3_9PEZI|nr:hypothetical protein B0T16DRAFT_411734 [Cercophora newfieldiana]